jgi:hypothetical protein
MVMLEELRKMRMHRYRRERMGANKDSKSNITSKDTYEHFIHRYEFKLTETEPSTNPLLCVTFIALHGKHTPTLPSLLLS